MRRLIFAAMIVAISSTAFSQSDDWVNVSASDSDDAYVKASSVVIDGSTRTAWVKLVPHSSGVTKEMLMKERYDCADETVTHLGGASYKRSGDNSPLSSQPAQVVIPDTVAASMMKALCSLKG